MVKAWVLPHYQRSSILFSHFFSGMCNSHLHYLYSKQGAWLKFSFINGLINIIGTSIFQLIPSTKFVEIIYLFLLQIIKVRITVASGSYDVFPTVENVADVWKKIHNVLQQSAEEFRSAPLAEYPHGKYPEVPGAVGAEACEEEMITGMSKALAWLSFSSDPVYQMSKILCQKAMKAGIETYMKVGKSTSQLLLLGFNFNFQCMVDLAHLLCVVVCSRFVLSSCP